MAKPNPNTQPIANPDPHDNTQAQKLREHENQLRKLDQRPGNKGGRN